MTGSLERKVSRKYVQEPIDAAPAAVKRIVERVLAAERDKLYLDRPHLINDVVTIIKEEIREGEADLAETA